MTEKHVEQEQGFATGVVSKRFWYNKQTPYYNSGLDEAVNFFGSPSGNLHRRPPTTIQADVGSQEGVRETRVIPWTLSTGDQLYVVIDPNEVKVYGTEGQGIYTNIIANPDMDFGFDHWTTWPGVWYYTSPPPSNYRYTHDWYIRNSGGDSMLAYAPQGDTRGNWYQIYQTVNVPIPTTEFEIGAIVTSYARETDRLGDPGEHLQWGFRIRQNGQQIFAQLYPESMAMAQRIVFPEPISGNIEVNIYQPTPSKYMHQRYFYVSRVALMTQILDETTGPPTFPSPYTEEQLRDIQFVQNPYEDQVVLTHEEVAAHEITYTAGLWDFGEITWAGAPNFGGTGNHAAVCGSYQGRLVLASSISKRQTCWLSKPGNWDDFGFDSANPSPGDGIEFTLSQVGKINWVNGHRDLMIGTANRIWRVISDSGLLQPGDIDARVQSSHGSRLQMPCEAGEQLFFSTAAGATLRSVEQTRDSMGWVAHNHSFWCSELLQQRIKRMYYVRDPWPYILAMTDTGQLLCMTYDPDLESHGMFVQGWFEWRLPWPVKDICVTRENGKDRVRIAVLLDNDVTTRVFMLFFDDPDEYNKDFGKSLVYGDNKELLTATEPSTLWRAAAHNAGYEIYVRHSNTGNIEGPILIQDPDPEIMPDGGSFFYTQEASTGVQIMWGMDSIMQTMPLSRFLHSQGHAAIRSWAGIGLRLLSSGNPDCFNCGPGDARLGLEREQSIGQIESGTRLYEKQTLTRDTEGQLHLTHSWPTNLCIVTAYGKAEVTDV